MAVAYKVNSSVFTVSNERFGELVRSGTIKPGDMDFYKVRNGVPKLRNELTLDEKRDNENSGSFNAEIYKGQ